MSFLFESLKGPQKSMDVNDVYQSFLLAGKGKIGPWNHETGRLFGATAYLIWHLVLIWRPTKESGRQTFFTDSSGRTAFGPLWKKRCTDNWSRMCPLQTLPPWLIPLKIPHNTTRSPQKNTLPVASCKPYKPMLWIIHPHWGQGNQPPKRNSGKLFVLKHKRGTPWKMNGWKIQPSPI